MNAADKLFKHFVFQIAFMLLSFGLLKKMLTLPTKNSKCWNINNFEENDLTY